MPNPVMRGDELIGLIRAFLYAGTPSVLVSHWLVDELSTRLFMEHFYRAVVTLAAQTDIGVKAEALAHTQSFIRNLTFAELKQLLVVDEGITSDVDQQLQYLAASAGFDSA